MISSEDLRALQDAVHDPGRVLTQEQVVARLSRDFYWYSPILRAKLDGKTAEAAVQPVSVDEVKAVLAVCFARAIPGNDARRRNGELRPGGAPSRWRCAGLAEDGPHREHYRGRSSTCGAGCSPGRAGERGEGRRMGAALLSKHRR